MELSSNTKQTKYCPKCEKNLDISLFHLNKARFDGLESACAKCLNSQRIERRKTESKEKRDKRLEYSKKYASNHKKATAKRSKNHYIKNREKLRVSRKEYRNNNKEIRCKKEREKRHADPVFKLRKNVSKDVARILKKNGNSKNGYSTFEHIGYTPQQLKEHIESLFDSWMNWHNHGMYDAKTWDDDDSSTWTWQIDHIIPHSKFPYTSLKDHLFKECWALSNLRPYPAKQNISEGNRR